MPKASKEQTLKVKLQARALFELGKYTQEEICKAIEKSGGSLTRKTLSKWINEDANDIWQVRDLAENRIYDAQKIVQKEKILRNFKKDEVKIKDDIVTQQATQDATQEAMVLVDLERERNKYMKEGIESLYYAIHNLNELIRKGKTGRITEEDVIWEGRKMKDPETGQTLKKQIKTVQEHKIPDITRAVVVLTKTLHGVGFFQSTPTVAIQNNNSNGKVVFVDKREVGDIDNHILCIVDDK